MTDLMNGGRVETRGDLRVSRLEKSLVNLEVSRFFFFLPVASIRNLNQPNATMLRIT